MNKRVFLGSLMTLVLLAGFTGCDEEYTTYKGPQYVMFADTLTVLGVEDSETYFDIRISATKPVEKDLTLAVEVIDSTAIEGVHYVLESNTVTIKEGQLATNVRVRANYESLEVGAEPVSFKLHLITDESLHWDLYAGTETKVMLQKICPFDVNAFTGYAMLTSTYLYNYVGSYNRLIETEVDTTQENTVILRDCFYEGYDVKIHFTTKDPLNPLIEMEDQPIATTGEAFGTIYGDGMLHAYQATSLVSYYSSCEKFILQYMTLHVPGMEGYNTVGTFINAIEWISDDEARILKGQGY